MVQYFGVIHPIVVILLRKEKKKRVFTTSRSRDSCQGLFKKLNIIPLQSYYTFTLLLYVIKNCDLYKLYVETHSINTRHGTDLHPPISKLIKFQEGAFYFGIKVVNHLPSSTENLFREEKQFRLALKRFLL